MAQTSTSLHSAWLGIWGALPSQPSRPTRFQASCPLSHNGGKAQLHVPLRRGQVQHPRRPAKKPRCHTECIARTFPRAVPGPRLAVYPQPPHPQTRTLPNVLLLLAQVSAPKANPKRGDPGIEKEERHDLGMTLSQLGPLGQKHLMMWREVLLGRTRNL